MDWLKDRIKRPKVVVDLSQIKELKGVREANGGVEIGAMTPLTEVVRNPIVREKFSLLMEAAELVASPQIRNVGTIGGNVSQDTRCWYYRGGWTCYRAGGNICYAGAQFYFEKVGGRQVWDFPLVNVASAIVYSGGRIDRARLVVNAVAAKPRRLKAVEASVIGKPRNEETADMAGTLAVEGAQTLRHNGYKVPLMRNLVKRAIRGAGTWTS